MFRILPKIITNSKQWQGDTNYNRNTYNNLQKKLTTLRG